VCRTPGVPATASTPSVDGGKKNPRPSIVKAELTKDSNVKVEQAFPGTPTVSHIATGKVETLNLTDPDSLTVAPSGDVVMISQDDSELLSVHKAVLKGGEGRVLHRSEASKLTIRLSLPLNMASCLLPIRARKGLQDDAPRASKAREGDFEQASIADIYRRPDLGSALISGHIPSADFEARIGERDDPRRTPTACQPVRTRRFDGGKSA
jgi:hypothetical protein